MNASVGSYQKKSLDIVKRNAGNWLYCFTFNPDSYF